MGIVRRPADAERGVSNRNDQLLDVDSHDHPHPLARPGLILQRIPISLKVLSSQCHVSCFDCPSATGLGGKRPIRFVKPTADSGGILELALGLENGKRPAPKTAVMVRTDAVPETTHPATQATIRAAAAAANKLAWRIGGLLSMGTSL
jgi:hypothetical protein